MRFTIKPHANNDGQGVRVEQDGKVWAVYSSRERAVSETRLALQQAKMDRDRMQREAEELADYVSALAVLQIELQTWHPLPATKAVAK